MTYSVLQASLVPAGLAHYITDQWLSNAASKQKHDGKGENGNQMQFPWQHPKKRESDWGWKEFKKKKKEETRISVNDLRC